MTEAELKAFLDQLDRGWFHLEQRPAFRAAVLALIAERDAWRAQVQSEGGERALEIGGLIARAQDAEAKLDALAFNADCEKKRADAAEAKRDKYAEEAQRLDSYLAESQARAEAAEALAAGNAEFIRTHMLAEEERRNLKGDLRAAERELAERQRQLMGRQRPRPHEPDCWCDGCNPNSWRNVEGRALEAKLAEAERALIVYRNSREHDRERRAALEKALRDLRDHVDPPEPHRGGCPVCRDGEECAYLADADAALARKEGP